MILHYTRYNGTTASMDFVSIPPGFHSKADVIVWAEKWDKITAFLRGDAEGYFSPITGDLILTKIVR